MYGGSVLPDTEAVLPAYNPDAYRSPILLPRLPATPLHIYVSVLPVLPKYWYMPGNTPDISSPDIYGQRNISPPPVG